MSGVHCVCVFMNVSNSSPWLTVQSAPSSIIGLAVYRKKARRDSVCFEAKSPMNCILNLTLTCQD